MAVRDLRGRRVLITGAGSGIGRACAHAFAKEGARLILSDVNQIALDEAKQELGGDVIALTCDVSSEASVAAFAKEVLERAGSIDVLINNAGIGYLGSFLNTPTDAWRRVIDINVMGIVHMTQAFLPSMRADRRQKSIVNVSSGLGFAGSANMSAYCASKHAVVGLSEVLAQELHDSAISVTIVAPGIINTNIVKGRGNVADGISDQQVERLQAYYDANGCDASVVARDIVGAVRSGQVVLTTGPFARLMCGMVRLSRPLARKMSIRSSKQIGFI